MWAVYIEWSTIARTAIKDRKLLRSLGFLGRKSASGEEEIVDEAARAARRHRLRVLSPGRSR